MPFRHRRLLITVFLFLGLLIFFIIGWSGRGRRLPVLLLRPFVALGRGLNYWPAYFRRTADLQTKNIRLQEQMEKLVLDQIKLESLQAENQQLKNLLNFKNEKNKSLIAARIIYHLRDPFSIRLRLDQGSKEGVRKEMVVLANQGLYLGLINSVWDHESEVQLALDPQSKAPARVLGRGGARGVLEGRGVLYRLTLIPANLGVAIDDLVVAEQENNPAEAWPVGRVAEIITNPETPFLDIVVEPLVDARALLLVGILN